MTRVFQRNSKFDKNANLTATKMTNSKFDRDKNDKNPDNHSRFKNDHQKQ